MVCTLHIYKDILGIWVHQTLWQQFGNGPLVSVVDTCLHILVHIVYIQLDSLTVRKQRNINLRGKSSDRNRVC